MIKHVRWSDDIRDLMERLYKKYGFHSNNEVSIYLHGQLGQESIRRIRQGQVPASREALELLCNAFPDFADELWSLSSLSGLDVAGDADLPKRVCEIAKRRGMDTRNVLSVLTSEELDRLNKSV